MKVIDLTHTIKPNMPVFPGTEPPQLSPASTFEQDGFRETLLNMYSHTGTHMDAPAHVREDGITLDKFPADKFVGKALVIDCSDLSEGDIIDISYINKYKNIIDEAEFILFKTNWDKYWDTEKYYGKFPVINDEVADFLISSNKKGIGLDVISIESIDSEDLPMHHKILKNNLVIIENLCNLDQIGNNLFTFCALPLKFIDSDGASIRAIAILD
ncbi:cyclase family protein [Intestinibacter bartlettii]|uniref:Cyclase family protein n=1 Tax=Intestinibacter bartlettii TaxID=261299 RepID=A0ABS6E036_9FIRM|nr:cyclase family protein [Intestinibacter bartlettii]MBU5337468.1 cyclase family protein [Intestinibacter bartlettii]MDO5011002.1 cyclase family protein [Intestinibacter bartlettii]